MEQQRKDRHAHARAVVPPVLGELCRDVRAAAARVAEEPSDADAIHDYRVALRRLRTVLAASVPLFRKAPLSRVRGELRRLAHAAGRVRDEEVLVETLAAFDLPATTRERVDAWLQGRAARERRLRAAIVTELACGAPALAALLSSVEALPVRRKAADLSMQKLARGALREAEHEVLEQAGRPDAETPEARHRLRIRWKRVRYTAELFSDALAGEGPSADALERLIEEATRMQKRLGQIHDLDEAIARVVRARRLSPGDRMVAHHRLRIARAELSARLAKELPDALSSLHGDRDL